MKLVKMIRPDGLSADVHPDMVDDYKLGNYLVVQEIKDEPKKQDAVSGGYDGLSTEELRGMVKGLTGEKPHHKTGRDKLIGIIEGAK